MNKESQEITEPLEQFIDRIERLEDEKSGIQEGIKEVYFEAKATGLDPKVMREIVKIRKMNPDDVDEQESLLHLYKQALGMESTPTT